MFTIHLELFMPLSERYITLYIDDDVFHVYIVELETVICEIWTDTCPTFLQQLYVVRPNT